MTNCASSPPRAGGRAPGHSLDPTALVHEAYLRLVGDQQFDGRGHFFAAAEAMRRVLVNYARDRNRLKRGGARQRVDLDRLTGPTRSGRWTPSSNCAWPAAPSSPGCAGWMSTRGRSWGPSFFPHATFGQVPVTAVQQAQLSREHIAKLTLRKPRNKA